MFSPIDFADISNPSTGISNVTGYIINGIAILHINNATVTSGVVGTLASIYKPKTQVNTFARMTVSGKYEASMITVDTDGKLYGTTFTPNTNTRDLSPTGTNLYGEIVYEIA